MTNKGQQVMDGPEPTAKPRPKEPAPARKPADKKLAAEIAKLKAETDQIQVHVAADSIGLEAAIAAVEWEATSNKDHRVYVFNDEVSEGSAEICMHYLSRWARMSTDEPVEIQMTTPGGSVWHGMALVDHMEALRKQGLHIQVTVRGVCASMGVLILQAASERVMGPRSTLLIHKLSGGMPGTLDQMKDYLKWSELMQDQGDALLAERSTLTVKQIKARMDRADWSVGPEEALKLGLIDRIG